MTTDVVIQLRAGNKSDWEASNPILAAGEVGLELDTRRFKVGDGNTPWSLLDYYFYQRYFEPMFLLGLRQ